MSRCHCWVVGHSFQGDWRGRGQGPGPKEWQAWKEKEAQFWTLPGVRPSKGRYLSSVVESFLHQDC